MTHDDLIPYPPNSPRGLVARWVSWVASSGPVRSPLADTTGRYAHRHQPADVFFLAGSFGGTIHRQIKAPAGRALFLPVITLWAPVEAGLPVMASADGSAVLDGEKLEISAIGTPTPFTVKGAFGNPVTRRRVPMQLRCWGLWAQTEPLPAGVHDLTVEGNDGADFQVGAVYRITVTG